MTQLSDSGQVRWVCVVPRWRQGTECGRIRPAQQARVVHRILGDAHRDNEVAKGPYDLAESARRPVVEVPDLVGESRRPSLRHGLRIIQYQEAVELPAPVTKRDRRVVAGRADLSVSSAVGGIEHRFIAVGPVTGSA